MLIDAVAATAHQDRQFTEGLRNSTKQYEDPVILTSERVIPE